MSVTALQMTLMELLSIVTQIECICMLDVVSCTTQQAAPFDGGHVQRAAAIDSKADTIIGHLKDLFARARSFKRVIGKADVAAPLAWCVLQLLLNER